MGRPGRIIFFLSFIFCFYKLSAHKGLENHNRIVKYDSTVVQIAEMPGEKLETFRQDKDFQYAIDKVHPNSFLEKIWAWIVRIYNNIIKSAGNVFPVIKYVLIAGLILLIIWLTLKNRPGNIFYKVKESDSIQAHEEEIDLNKTNIDELISGAVSEKNYRLAVRFLYLKLLKKLADASVISWEKNKTNRDYYYEIAKDEHKKEFVKLSAVYEYYWYGGFKPGKNIFLIYQKRFHDFLEKIND